MPKKTPESVGATCDACNQNMAHALSCLGAEFILIKEKKGKKGDVYTSIPYTPIPYGYETVVLVAGLNRKDLSPRCHDCNVILGAVHHSGCCVQECPICGKQPIECGHQSP